MNMKLKLGSILIASLSLCGLSACQTVSKATTKAGSWIGLGDSKTKVPEIDKEGVIDISETTFEQIQNLTLNMPKGQWLYIENEKQGVYALQNKSEDEFVLSFKLNCKIPSQQPTFDIQDKNGKIVLTGLDSQYGTIQFLLDNTNYGNPFIQIKSDKLDIFKAKLNTTQTIKIFNSGKLYTFANQKNELLDKLVTCF